MKKKIFTTFFTVLLLAALNWGSLLPQTNQKNRFTRKPTKRLKVKDLDKKYRDWLDLVHYIISPLEKSTFMRLTNNRDRDSFLNLFWKLRDPTEGTPENEYRQEHIKRFSHANKYFGYATPLPGWKTDRGRMYILLGPPISENEVFKGELYPVLIWDYYGGPAIGLPTAFHVAFYKKSGVGEYRLYIPTIDGPAALLKTSLAQVNPTDYAGLYKKIHEIEPAVAEICLSLIPGENLSSLSPSLQAPLLIARIYELPTRKLNTSYARHFLNYKGVVETSVMTDYISLRADLYVLKEPILDLNFVHFALRPDRISVGHSPETDQYYFNYNLIVVLKKGEDVVMEYTKNFPFYYTKEELEERISHGVIITDYFPVIEGDYKLITVLQNSVNKEVSYFEKDIRTAAPTSSPARVFGPLVSYQSNTTKKAGFAAFTIMGTTIKIDPKHTFGLNETLYSTIYVDKGTYKKNIRAQMEVVSQDENRPYTKTYSFPLPQGKKFHGFTQPLEKLKYGNYALKAKILGEGDIVLETQEKNFMVSPFSHVPHPPSASKILKNENHFLFYMMLANQYENIKNTGKAGQYFEKALALNPSYSPLVKAYAASLLKQKNYDRVLAIVENIKTGEKDAFDYYALKGKALYYKEQYREAVGALLEANKIYDSDVTVLNTLGFSFIRLGNIEEAKRALSASLVINQYQKNIVEIIERLKQNEKNKNK
jgi:GWxTD domain-containing protein